MFKNNHLPSDHAHTHCEFTSNLSTKTVLTIPFEGKLGWKLIRTSKNIKSLFRKGQTLIRQQHIRVF